MVKYIIVSGGVISGIGKGITASSIGLILQARGLKITAIKIDPYLNVDAGTMSPFEHGECYVLEDGGEVDLDLGNYERFLNINLSKDHSITTGKVYNNVIQKERNGEYLGKTVQINPHITNEIQRMITDASKDADVCIIEVGGTIGDIETTPFIEALRQLSYKHKDKHSFCFVHVSMIVSAGMEYKTKPTQQSIATLRSLGIFPDILIIRTPSTAMLDDEIKQKLETLCNISKERIISNVAVPNIYYVPDVFEKQCLFDIIGEVLGFSNHTIVSPPNFHEYHTILQYFDNLDDYPHTPKKYTVAIAGKYLGCQDAYLSLIRAIEHAVFRVSREEIIPIKVAITWIDVETYYSGQDINADAVIISGGFGTRGIIGKLKVAEYCRTHRVPVLGICLGMQVMVAEFARNVCGLDARSSEWDIAGEDLVIDILPDQTGVKGGTMRLGSQTTHVSQGSQVFEMYGGADMIEERHRHRYEVNNKYVDMIEKYGLKFVGKSVSGRLMEITELPNHPYYIGCQFHPEFKTKYNQPHPLFVGLIRTMVGIN